MQIFHIERLTSRDTTQYINREVSSVDTTVFV